MRSWAIFAFRFVETFPSYSLEHLPSDLLTSFAFIFVDKSFSFRFVGKLFAFRFVGKIVPSDSLEHLHSYMLANHLPSYLLANHFPSDLLANGLPSDLLANHLPSHSFDPFLQIWWSVRADWGRFQITEWFLAPKCMCIHWNHLEEVVQWILIFFKLPYYLKYSDTITAYNSCPKLWTGPFYYLLTQ